MSLYASIGTHRLHPDSSSVVWIPGVDEIPMSLSYLGDHKGITVKNVGEATKALTSLQVGDRIIVRGPYGRSYRAPKGKVLVVGGGTAWHRCFRPWNASRRPTFIPPSAPEREGAALRGALQEDLLGRPRLHRRWQQGLPRKRGAAGQGDDVLHEYDMVLGCARKRCCSSCTSCAWRTEYRARCPLNGT